MAKVEAEKSSSYSLMERILYLFFIPVIFTVILTIVLLSIFDYNVFNTLLSTANKIPLIEKIVPEPKVQNEQEDTAAPAVNVDNVLAELEQKNAELSAQIEANRQLQDRIRELEASVAAYEEQLQEKTISEEEYLLKIQRLAGMYAKMNPRKAAPIMENLATAELVLLLEQMGTDDQIEILEKMNPDIAAKVSILLKDTVPVRDRQIAALQERLAMRDSNPAGEKSGLTHAELAQTLAGMGPANAAALLLEMKNINEAQVIQVLRTIDLSSRAAILSAMSGLSEQETARITAKLGN